MEAMVRMRGSYALAMMFKDHPGEVWVARKDSPMIIGIADGETYVASDVPAILKYTRNVYYIGNDEVLSYAGRVKVLEPRWLADEIREAHRMAVERYE